MLSSIQFSELIFPIETSVFFGRYWEKSYLVIHRKTSGYYGELLSYDSIDSYFSYGNPHPDTIKVYKEKKSISSKYWTSIKTLPTGNTVRIVDKEQLMVLYSQGASLIIDRGHLSFETLSQLCRQLENELGFTVKSNIYMSPSSAMCFPIHYDAHDVIVLQVSGSKSWSLYNSKHPKLPVEREEIEEETSELELKETVELKSGDLLYIPRGVFHKAETIDQASIHISIGLYPKYGYQLLEFVMELAKKKVCFRQALPHKLTPELIKKDMLDVLSESITSLCRNIDIEDIFDDQNRHFQAQSLQNNRHFNDLMKLDSVTLCSKVCKYHDITPSVERSEQHLVIGVINEQVILPSYLEQAFTLFLQDRPFLVDDIQGLINEQGKIDLVCQFVSVGLLQILDT